MKQKFSIKWKASKQVRKKRKYLANAPLHLRHKIMSSNLSKELRKKYSRKSFPVRKGDNVKVMRGKFKGKSGKISNVDRQKIRVSVENLQTQKKDGTKVNVYFNTSNLQIQELSLEDKKREASLRKGKNVPKETKEEKKIKGEKNAPKKK